MYAVLNKTFTAFEFRRASCLKVLSLKLKTLLFNVGTCKRMFSPGFQFISSFISVYSCLNWLLSWKVSPIQYKIQAINKIILSNELASEYNTLSSNRVSFLTNDIDTKWNTLYDPILNVLHISLRSQGISSMCSSLWSSSLKASMHSHNEIIFFAYSEWLDSLWHLR